MRARLRPLCRRTRRLRDDFSGGAVWIRQPRWCWYAGSGPGWLRAAPCRLVSPARLVLLVPLWWRNAQGSSDGSADGSAGGAVPGGISGGGTGGGSRSVLAVRCVGWRGPSRRVAYNVLVSVRCLWLWVVLVLGAGTQMALFSPPRFFSRSPREDTLIAPRLRVG